MFLYSKHSSLGALKLYETSKRSCYQIQNQYISVKLANVNNSRLSIGCLRWCELTLFADIHPSHSLRA